MFKYVVVSFRSDLLVSGVSCERCDDNHYGNPLVAGGSCERCLCNGNIDTGEPGSCDPNTGECLKCLYNTEGFGCERCREGYWGDAQQHNCQCKYIIIISFIVTFNILS